MDTVSTIPTSIIPTHDLASWLLRTIDRFLDWLGLHKYQTLEEVIYFIIIVVASYFIGWLIQRLILFISRKVVKLRHTEAGDELLKEATMLKCSKIIPPLVFLSLAPFAFDSKSEMLSIIIRLSVAYTCFMIAYGVNAILTFFFTRYNSKENTKNLPIKGILNVGHGVIWGVALIVAISVIVQKSPAALLGGLTAFAAVLMLVFKDSILGLVAGVQMSQNDMLHVGDWIVVPSTPANGTVVDVSLTTVKVRNFDNTLVMVPPYTLVSTSFQNWRGMSESGVRRVAQSIYINPDSISALDPDMTTKLTQKYPALKPFVENLQQKGETVAWNPGNAPLNGTIETNIGLFRAYMVSYLLASPMVDKQTDLMLSIQPMTPEGVPLQIYCFAVTTQWEAYEGVLSAIMEHALYTASDFGLEILSGDHLSIDQKIDPKMVPAT